MLQGTIHHLLLRYPPLELDWSSVLVCEARLKPHEEVLFRIQNEILTELVLAIVHLRFRGFPSEFDQWVVHQIC